MKKRVIIDIFIVLIVLLTIKVVGFVKSIPDFSIRNDIYDDEEMIMEIQVNSSYNNHDVGVKMSLSDYEGITNLFEIYAKNNEASLTFEYDAEVTKGSFKCVLVTPDNEIIDIGEQSGKEMKVLNLKKGFYYLKVVAKDSATVNYSVDVTGIDLSNVHATYKVNI
jgi:hypothetical protein